MILPEIDHVSFFFLQSIALYIFRRWTYEFSVGTIFSEPNCLRCIDYQIFLPVVLRCVRFERARAPLLILHEPKLYFFTLKFHFGFEVKMMPIEDIQEFGSVGAKNVTSGQSGRFMNHWPARGLQTEQSFSMVQDFRQRSEAVGLSQVSKMLQQLRGLISAHHSSSKITNTHLRLFRPDQGPHTVLILKANKMHECVNPAFF